MEGQAYSKKYGKDGTRSDEGDSEDDYRPLMNRQFAPPPPGPLLRYLTTQLEKTPMPGEYNLAKWEPCNPSSLSPIYHNHPLLALLPYPQLRLLSKQHLARPYPVHQFCTNNHYRNPVRQP